MNPKRCRARAQIVAIITGWCVASTGIGMALEPDGAAEPASAALVPVAALLTPSPTPRPRPTPEPTSEPTASPAPTPAPTPDPCRASGDSATDLERRVRCAWPGPQPGHPASDDEAVWTVDNESSWKVNAHGCSGTCHSFWQFKLGTYHSSGCPGHPEHDPIETQTRCAWEQYERNGWWPWPASRRRFGPE